MDKTTRTILSMTCAALFLLGFAPGAVGTHEQGHEQEPAKDQGTLVERCVQTREGVECTVLGVDAAGLDKSSAPSTAASVTIRYTRTPAGCTVTADASVKGLDSATTYTYELGMTSPFPLQIGAIGEPGPVLRVWGPFTVATQPGDVVTIGAHIENDQNAADSATVVKTFVC